jgi:hypothetical protein
MLSNHAAASRITVTAPSFSSQTRHPLDNMGKALARWTCLWAREGTIKKRNTTSRSGTLASREGRPLSGLSGRPAGKWERHGPQHREVSCLQKPQTVLFTTQCKMPNKSRTCVLSNLCRSTPFLNKIISHFDFAATAPRLL